MPVLTLVLNVHTTSLDISIWCVKIIESIWSHEIFQDDLVGLKRLTQKQVNHTVWITHFPSAIILTNHHMLRQLMATSIVHVCGHLHTLAGIMPHMYGKHPSGHLELELGDFIKSRRFVILS